MGVGGFRKGSVRRFVVRLIAASFVCAITLMEPDARAANYVYDANGRLRAVTNTAGESAEYVYDALGNMLAIDRIPANQLAIFAFVPNYGPIGTTVTIDGQGFSATAANDALTFNGTSATVTSATANRLVANVPTGATTGPLSVTVSGTTASSLENFIVTQGGSDTAPVITSFTPAVADATTTVTVIGQHFATAAGPIQAGVNEFMKFVTPASDTQLAFQVPAETGSGPVTVTTAYGSAQSTQALIVVPSSIGSVNVVDSAALTVGGVAHSFSIPTANKYVAAIFSVSTGELLSLQFSQLTTAPAGVALNVSVFDSSGASVLGASTSVYSTALSVQLPAVTRAGTYTVIATPAQNATAQFSMSVESDPFVTTAGPLQVATTISGQSERFGFTATAGENLGLGLRPFTISDTSNPASFYAYATVYGPSGADFGTFQCYVTNGGCETNLSNLAAGTYSVVVRPYPYGTGTMSFTATLSDDKVVALPVNISTSVSLSRIGQNGRLTFSGTAGATVAVQMGGITTTPAGQYLLLTVYAPDGTAISGQSTQTATGYTFNLANLPTTGTYTIFVDPFYAATANLTAKLVPSGSAAVPINGSGLSVSTTASGQYAYFSFTATAGENLGLGLRPFTISDTSNPASFYAYATVYGPSGADFGTFQCYVTNGGCETNLSNLAAGTYSVVVRPYPYGTGTMSFTATLSDDKVVALPVNSATSVSLSRIGQNGRLTFSGTAGATVAVQMGGITTTPAGQYLLLTVYAPDGTAISGQSTQTATGYTFNLANLPTTGTYTIFVDPFYAATANLTAKLVPSGSAAVPINGSGLSVSTTASGQYAYFSFTATAGENLGLGLRPFTISDTSNPASFYAYATVYGPSGADFGTFQCYVTNGGCETNLSNLAAGTYSVVVRPYPYGTGTMSFTATLSDDKVVALPVNSATSVSLSRIGQNGRLTFSGTAGTTVAVQMGGITTTPAGQYLLLTAYAPDGTAISGQSTQTATGYTFNLANLPTTGTYTIFVDPFYAATANLTAKLVPSGSAAVPINGSGLSVSTTASGQYAYFSFTATAGENLGLGLRPFTISDTSNPASFYAYATVYGPSGADFGTFQCYVTNGGCETNLSNLAAGTYSVVVRPYPYGTGTMSFTATLSDDKVVALPSSTGGTPAMISLGRAGQNGRLTFSGVQGGSKTVTISGIATTPSGQYVNLSIFDDKGVPVSGASASTTSGHVFNLTNLPKTCTYTVLVDPQYGVTATMNGSRSP